jgi:hypothetical protein
MRYSDIVLTGKSGAIYRFQVWSLETPLKAVPAAYIVTRRAQENSNYNSAAHEIVYIGEASSLADPFATASDFNCFRKHGANCICIHRVEDDRRRREVAQDLALAHGTPCGEKGKLDRLAAPEAGAEAPPSGDRSQQAVPAG